MKVKKVLSYILVAAMMLSVFAIPATAVEGSETVVHYYNENNWQNPYIYYYSDGNTPVSWPGTAMNNDGDNWYSYTISNFSSAKVIFSNNGADQYPAQNQEGLTVSGEKWYKSGVFYDQNPDLSKITVHYYNSNAWNNPYISYYTDNSQPVTWPGRAMTSDGNGWYSYDIYGFDEAKVIFSDNGANQIPPQNETGYTVTGEKWFVNGTLYDAEPDGITVHFYDYNKWGNVNIYYYSGNLEGTSWAGVPMNADGDGWYTYKIYGYNEVRVLFNNGRGAQIPGVMEEGFLVSGEMWYRNGTWTTERPDEITVYFYKPDGWSNPNIYYYLNDSDTGAAWPGTAMTEVSDGWYSYTITKYSSAKVMFNDGTNQIPAQNQPGLDASGVMWYKNGVWCNSETDTDGDKLPDYMELVYNTNINNADTDGDGLPDGFEVLTLYTDPLNPDSDNNGINDGAEDADEDKLTNLQEYTFGTNPTLSDTDEDGLSDYDEIYTYFTDPLEKDTDGDGLSDRKEIDINYVPNVANDSFDMYFENSDGDENVIPSVEIKNISGSQAESLDIQPVDDYVLLDENIPGYIGKAFDFSINGTFETATISFEFNSNFLNSDDFEPCIYYYNEETQLLEELPNQIIKDNIVTAETTHFSKYILLNKIEYNEIWKNDIRKPSENYQNMDIVFVIDISYSMYNNDPDFIRKTVTNNFINNLREGDKSALVAFRGIAEVKQGLTSNKNDTITAVNALQNDNGYNSLSGTNGSQGLYTAFQLFNEQSQDNAEKVIIFLTDGEDTTTSYSYDEIISQAINNNICIYSIGLGDKLDETNLTNIASQTNGKYYKSDVATDLIADFKSIFIEYIDYYTDTNRDGISDYFTALMCSGDLRTGTGKKLFEDIPLAEIQKNNDYDGDGIINGDEVKVIFNSKIKRVYLNVKSSPVDNDLDKDGVKDGIDQNSLKTDKYEYGAIIHNNLVYPIKVPDCNETYLDSTDWKTDFDKPDSKITTDELEFVFGALTGISFDDNSDLKSKGIYAGPVLLNELKNEQKIDCTLGSIFLSIEGISNNIQKVYDDIKIRIILQSSSNQRRAYILAGSHKNSEFYNQYAGSIPYSDFWDSCGGFTTAGAIMSKNISAIYKSISGDENDYGTYDLRISVDFKHKDEVYSSYLWINNKMQLIENPKIYPDDRVEIVQLNFFGQRKKVLYTLPISSSCKVSSEYKAFFDQFISENELDWSV